MSATPLERYGGQTNMATIGFIYAKRILYPVFSFEISVWHIRCVVRHGHLTRQLYLLVA
jgi:hypothetical protein